MADALILEVVTATAAVAEAEVETAEDPGKAILTEITAKVNKLKELPQRRAVESDGWGFLHFTKFYDSMRKTFF
jgi:hypothetical protein